jgi:hypothetical protein
LAPFRRDGTHGSQSSQALDVVVEGGRKLFENLGQLGEVGRIHSPSAQFLNAIFQAT